MKCISRVIYIGIGAFSSYTQRFARRSAEASAEAGRLADVGRFFHISNLNDVLAYPQLIQLVFRGLSYHV